ncbi:MAG: RodZ domain-containing protein [Rhodanobacteraceae bacterium]
MSKKRKKISQRRKMQHARIPDQCTASPENESAAESASSESTDADAEAQSASDITVSRVDDDQDQSAREQQARDLGRQLRQAREKKGMDLDEAAHQMHLPWRVVAKLESGDWKGIDSPIYLHGYLRSYTSLLGMETPSLVEDVAQQVSAPQALVSTGGISRGRYLMQRYAVASTYLVITALIVVPVIILGINGGLKHNLARLAPLDPAPVTRGGGDKAEASTATGVTDEQSAQTAQQKPLMASMAPVNLIDQGQPGTVKPARPAVQKAPEAPPSAPTQADGSLVIELHAPSWVEVTSSGGDRLAYALLEAGKHVFRGKGLTVRLGNAGAAEVRMDGQKLDLRAYQRANVAYFRVDSQGELHNPPDA